MIVIESQLLIPIQPIVTVSQILQSQTNIRLQTRNFAQQAIEYMYIFCFQ